MILGISPGVEEQLAGQTLSIPELCLTRSWGCLPTKKRKARSLRIATSLWTGTLLYGATTKTSHAHKPTSLGRAVFSIRESVLLAIWPRLPAVKRASRDYVSVASTMSFIIMAIGNSGLSPFGTAYGAARNDAPAGSAA